MTVREGIFTREQVVAEARTWLGTPYHLKACVKGAGCDCFSWLADVMVKANLMDPQVLPHYGSDWFCHITDEQYLLRLARFATRLFSGVIYLAKPAPGCVLAVKAGNTKVFNHAGLVTKWPMLMHAITPKVVEINALTHYMWAFREIVVFDPWEAQGGDR